MSNFARKSSPSSPSVSPPPASKSDSTNKAGVKPFEKSKESEQNMPDKMQTPEPEKQKPTSLSIAAAAAAAATPDSKENAVDPSSKSAKEVRPEVVKAKKRRLYEHAAPVYDNRQIFAADLLQTQLDYQGNLR